MAQEKSKPLLSVAEAKEKILTAINPVDFESIRVMGAAGRILAEQIISNTDLPSFANSSMDGFAVKSADILSASATNPIELRVVADIPAGANPSVLLQAGQAARIMTGAVVPDSADSVVPVEFTDQFKSEKQFETQLPEVVKIYRRANPGEYIRPRGLDFKKGEILLQPRRLLKPQDLGLLAMLGIREVKVYRRPKVAMISTGDELTPIDEQLGIGKIYDSNAYTLTAQIERDGGQPHYLGIALDREDSVRELLSQACSLNADLIITSAGVSVGAFDFVRQVVEEKGELGFWKVNIRPGKPLVFGQYCGIPLIGLPGNPVSAFVCYEVFIRPAILKLTGEKVQAPPTMRVKLSEGVESDGRESYLRGIVEKQSGVWNARLTGHQGSGNLLSLVQANALLIIPSEVKSLPSGAEVEVLLIGEIREEIY